jgi:hypothetical protein
MRAGGSGPAITITGDRRVTCVGTILRKFKLDELPQFINVLKGDMSMIGPRPEVPEFVEPGNRLWDQVLMVRPGITDLATLLYRNEEQLLASSAQPELDYHRTILPAKLALNIEYMRSRSLRRDIRLLFLTAWYSCSRAVPGPPCGKTPSRMTPIMTQNNAAHPWIPFHKPSIGDDEVREVEALSGPDGSPPDRGTAQFESEFKEST